jgi:Ala-tRNA(Pro) deacylase
MPMDLTQLLTDRRVAFEVVVHPPAFSAQRRAKYLHVPGSRVAKAVLLAGAERFLVAVLPATHYVDVAALAAHLNEPLRLASGPEVAGVFRDCEWGVVPAFGSLYRLTTVLEETLDPDGLFAFEAGAHGRAVRIRCRDFEGLERPRRLRFARPYFPGRKARGGKPAVEGTLKVCG